MISLTCASTYTCLSVFIISLKLCELVKFMGLIYKQK